MLIVKSVGDIIGVGIAFVKRLATINLETKENLNLLIEHNPIKIQKYYEFLEIIKERCKDAGLDIS